MNAPSAMPRQGHISYELARALVLVEDIDRAGGLSQGGEPRPDASSCEECGSALLRCLRDGQADGWRDRCFLAMAMLGAALQGSGRACRVSFGPHLPPLGHGAHIDELRRFSAEIVETMPPAWMPVRHRTAIGNAGERA